MKIDNEFLHDEENDEEVMTAFFQNCLGGKEKTCRMGLKIECENTKG